MKFTIDGREYYDYQLSNEQIVKLIEGGTLMGAEKAILTEKIYERFKYTLCPKSGENMDDVFARFFSSFANGKLTSKKHVAKVMCSQHRWIQNEMFKVCLAYIKLLAENYENGRYDGRNEYAAEASKKIIDYFKEIDYPY